MIPRAEYPRPQFERASWLNLNGAWEFEFDDHDSGLKERWYQQSKTFTRTIQVPYCYQSQLSGIHDTDFHDVVWYRKQLQLSEEFKGKRAILHFGAVDYEAQVWVNGHLAATHVGGHTPFSADISNLLDTSAENTIVVRARDYHKDVTVPRGKQFWKERSESIFYTGTTGIWQTVWLEPVDTVFLEKTRLTADIDADEIHIRSFIRGEFTQADVRLQINISYKGEAVSEDIIQVRNAEMVRSIKLNPYKDNHRHSRLWRPESPNLYDIEFVITVDGQETDRVKSYFGMRKVSYDNGVFSLNNKPYYMKLVLDQGYFPTGLLTAPSDEDLRKDVELTKEMGFNGARKHQKVEDPRYLYWCDQLGLLVWGEMANSHEYSEQYVGRIVREWQEAIERDYNHPSLVVWVPINESWGVSHLAVDKEQQYHALTMYYLTKSLDRTRPVISNDGWEHVKSDICSIHDYESSEEVLRERYSTVERTLQFRPSRKPIYVPGYFHQGEPILVTEFGGISFRKSDWEGWGYSAASNERDYLERLQSVVRPLLQSQVVQGFCYTQLTDVEQEINGLVTYDRQLKVPLELIRMINEGKELPEEALAALQSGDEAEEKC
ncbi:MAG: glycoside hydrolase family 2 [Paenibacillus sp.]|nr:glycoside hydrolase family 2 [Paenibacillus sp.]